MRKRGTAKAVEVDGAWYKECAKCGKTKSVSEFCRDRKTADGYQYSCQPCGYVSHRRFLARRPDYAKLRMRKVALKRFGLSLSDYDAMNTRQAGKCLICFKTETRYSRLAVDHDHATGFVRGLLCHRCNGGLGLFNDDVEVMERAVAYLRVSFLKQRPAVA